MYQNEGKDHFALDTFRAAINMLIRTERCPDTVLLSTYPHREVPRCGPPIHLSAQRGAQIR
eukprot:1182503-Prorocentrum_minimum.AAC.6